MINARGRLREFLAGLSGSRINGGKENAHESINHQHEEPLEEDLRVGAVMLNAATRIVGFFVSAIGLGLIFHERRTT